MNSVPHASRPSGLAGLTPGAIGVVCGDIGTSPLYAPKEVFGPVRAPLTPDTILGILSLVFWSLTLIVSLKVVTLILRADNNGASALIARLAQPSVDGGMAPWREKLFAGMHRNAARAADFLHLPANRTVELGSQIHR